MTKLPEMTWRQLPVSPKAHGEMVDRGAEVIRSHYTNFDVDPLVVAREFIAAMREPTEAMKDAANPPGDDAQWDDLNETVVWRRMIDEALR